MHDSAVTTTQPTKIDWDLVRDLYIQQVPHRTIAERTGASIHAIRARAYRHRWAHATNNDLTANPPSQEELVKEWQFNMSISLLASSRWWSKHDLEPETLRDSKDLETARGAHIQSGRMLFGLDKDDGKPSNAWKSGAGAGPVIDVTPTISTGQTPSVPGQTSASAGDCPPST